ncbi:MAG: EthD family reductase [Ilumatobacteraceae bacterium]
MIKLSVSYPNGDGTTFDHDYYATSHVPLCVSTFSPVKTEIDKGIDGPNAAGVHFYFESMEGLQAALGSPQMGDVMADVANYTNIAPVMQISEVVS